MKDFIVEIVGRTIAQVANHNEWNLTEAMQWAKDEGILFYWYNTLFPNQFGGLEIYTEAVSHYVDIHLEYHAIDVTEILIITHLEVKK